MQNIPKDKKRFPATTDLDKETFLNDKKINGELYAYLQEYSEYRDDKETNVKITYVSKKKLPK